MNTKLSEFTDSVTALLERTGDEAIILQEAAHLLGELVSEDDWLPPSHAVPSSLGYRQYPLHVDPLGRFSVVSFVWGPGQATPVHDHGVWGLVGMLRGAELSQRYVRGADRMVPIGDEVRLEPGAVEAISPTVGDIHRVTNAFADRASISIHLYGGDIGCIERKTYALDGTEKRFVSGYSSLSEIEG